MHNDARTREKWQNQLAALWPAVKGSLAKVYKPCIRKHCPACARGDKHPAWLLSTSSQGRRTTRYVPLALVPTLKRAIQNGRRIDKILCRTGPELLKQHRQAVKEGLAKGTKS